jgi:alpha-1,6-mannosyltransferase
LGWKKALAVGALAIAVFVLSFSVFVTDELIQNFSSSIDLYFRNFEFNASVYYLAREIGFLVTGYNVIHYIGPGLSLITLALILGISLLKSRLGWSVFQTVCAGLTVYFLLATTVHPWYIITLVGLAPLCGWKFPLLWSAVAVLSYFHYINGGFEENYLIIALEYVILLAGAWFLDFSSTPKIKLTV